MKLDARCALLVYPVLKAQSHEKRCENILQKTTEHQYNPILGLLKNPEKANNRFSYLFAAINQSEQGGTQWVPYYAGPKLAPIRLT